MLARTAQDVGSLIREQRLAQGMSQAQLATATGTSRQWVVDVERGKPTLELGLVLRALTAVGLGLHLETTATSAVDTGPPSIDLDAILARARAPVAAPRSAPQPAKPAKGSARPPTSARGKTRR